MKVFGTGMQRTGTTSLAKALNHLGIPTRDHPKDLFDDIEHPVIREYVGDVWPCGTGVIMKGLAREEMLIEIDAYGFIDDPD